MIPKIIHFCWISGDDYPPKIQMCIDSWREKLPDYEICVWDYEKVHKLNVRWCEEAISLKKYAFVADYIRFYALYNYGGIYLDSDVQVLKSFDDLLNLKYFVGKENHGWNWEAAVIGAEKGIYWIADCLAYYKKRAFVNCFGELQTHVLPYIIDKIVHGKYKVKDCYDIQEWEWNDAIVCRFPVDWFSPKCHDTEELFITDNTYSIHHFTKSWSSNPPTDLRLTITQRLLGRCKRFLSYMKHDVLKL